jgi:sugar phosphate permease
MKSHHSPLRYAIFMFSLVFAGEAIFGLPFVVARVFRPTVLEVFGLTNLELGIAFSWYGMFAMAAYFPGGPIADRFSARQLMVVALLATGAGGVYYANIPSLGGLKLLYAFWGLTTILLFWAALIRATKEWGGEHGQGRAFGILDGGRGLFAAVLATATGFVFAALLPADVESATLAQKTVALQRVIWIFTGLTAVAAVFVWFCVPENRRTRVASRKMSEEDLQQAAAESSSKRKLSLHAIGTVLRNPAVWLQGVIVVCAYTGYKGTDDFGLFARDGFGFDDVQAAKISTLAFWVRPIAAVGAGMLGDRLHASHAVLLCFGALIVGDLVIALGLLAPSAPWMLYMAIAGTSGAVFGLRGVYFALFDEAHVPPALIGTATGLVSVIGYTPDIFMGPLMGKLTDSFPGALGHQFLFGALAGFATIGLVATLLFQRVASRARMA